ncbi:MAG: hypothetical protein PHU06_05790 [Gallionella sp.]|nr:hypothetical protein [Gallionella sp.]MDD4958094.1 hypothetical protein [Gallionella sp.]
MDWLNWIKSNEVLTLISTVFTVFGVVWAIFAWKYPKDDKPTSPTQSAKADHGGTAVNVAGENNKIHIGK